MSSLRNAVQRRNHKERSQPQNREKWGLLEKHKDYSLRAADYNLKKRKLSILSQKARDRHPDEFAFGMLSAEKSRQGKHGKNSTQNRLGHDTVKLLKTQDLGYLRTVGQKGRRQIEEVEREVQMGKVLDGISDEGGNRQHDIDADEDEEEESTHQPRGKRKGNTAIKKIKFVTDSDDEAADSTDQTDLPKQQPLHDNENEAEDSDDLDPRSRPASKTPNSTAASLRAMRKNRAHLRTLRAAKLQALKARQKEILAATEALEEQRARMSRTIGGVNAKGIPFMRKERKR